MGSEADWAQLDPDFAAGKKALVAEDWNGAIATLKLAALRGAPPIAPIEPAGRLRRSRQRRRLRRVARAQASQMRHRSRGLC
jgi:hypothetical protein